MSTAPEIKPATPETPNTPASGTNTAVGSNNPSKKIILPPPLVDESSSSQPPSLSPPKENTQSETPSAPPVKPDSNANNNPSPSSTPKISPGKITSEDVSKWVNENVTQDVSNDLADILFSVISGIFEAPYKIISPIINYLVTDKAKIKYILASWSLVGVITIILCIVLKLVSNSFDIVPWVIAVILDTIILMIFSGIIKSKISGIKRLKGVKILNRYLNLSEDSNGKESHNDSGSDEESHKEEITGDLTINDDEEELTFDDSDLVVNEIETGNADDLDFDLYEEVTNNNAELDFDVSNNENEAEGIADIEDALNSVSSIVKSIPDTSRVNLNKIKADLPISSPFEDEINSALEMSNISFKDSIRTLANESMSANNQMVINDLNIAFSSAEAEEEKAPPPRVRKFRGLMPIDDEDENV